MQGQTLRSGAGSGPWLDTHLGTQGSARYTFLGLVLRFVSPQGACEQLRARCRLIGQVSHSPVCS